MNWRTPGGLVLLDDLGAGDVRGHQVGRELDAVVAQVQGVGQRVDHQRLGQPGHADQQAVAAGEDRDQQLLEDGVLADDHLGHLRLEAENASLRRSTAARSSSLGWISSGVGSLTRVSPDSNVGHPREPVLEGSGHRRPPPR